MHRSGERCTRFGAGCVIAFGLTACGGSATSPGAVTTLTLTLPASVGVGESVRASAPVSAMWHSGDPSIATVTETGVVTGVRNGRTTITVTHDGQQAAANVRVVPEYRGQWSGTYRITQCTPGPSEVYRQTFCGSVDRTSGTVTFTLVRNGEFVTGQFQLFGAAFPAFSVPIAEDGSIQFTSTTVAVPTGAMKTDAQFTLNSGRRGEIDGRAYWLLSGSGGLVGFGIAEGPVTATAQ